MILYGSFQVFFILGFLSHIFKDPAVLEQFLSSSIVPQYTTYCYYYLMKGTLKSHNLTFELLLPVSS